MSFVLPLSLVGVMRSRGGVVTTGELRWAGCSDRVRQRLEREGFLVRVHPGVYRVSTSPVDTRSQCAAALLAAPGCAVSGPTAGSLFGLRRCVGDDIHVITTRRGLKLDGVIVHVTNALGPSDTTSVGGVLTLRPARLAPDLARFLSDGDLESAIEQMLDRSMVSVPALHAMARRLRTSGRDGIQRYLRVLNGRPAWRKPVGSALELRFFAELDRRGIGLVRQFRLDLVDGSYVVFDAADPETRTAVEVDHVTWHGGRVDSQDDKRRDRRTLAAGWTTIRVTDEDVNTRMQATATEVEAIVRSRRASLVHRRSA